MFGTSSLRSLCSLALGLWILLPQPQAQAQVPDSEGQWKDPLRFAVLGDFGSGRTAEREVADMVKSLKIDFIVTVGDNNYPDGAAATIDKNVGQFFHEFIHPYTGSYGPGAKVNRFWPSLGNHDWRAPNAQPYLDYFTLPGNERYYEKRLGSVHLFSVDSDDDEPDGIDANSIQAQWLQSALQASTAPFKVVFMHHAPYSSSSNHGSNTTLQWPYKEWGASVVLAGHDHTYERLIVDGLPYFVNGLGGQSIYNLGSAISGSKYRYNDNYGAMLVEASKERAVFWFINRAGNVLDTFTLTNPAPMPTEVVLVPTGSTWKYLDDGSDQGTAWRDPGFDDSSWQSGDAQLGYGDGDEATVVGFGPNPNQKYTTTYFRHRFQYSLPTPLNEIVVRLLRDDGGVVYLNGVEIFRSNMPAGTITSSTFASSTVGGGEEDSYFPMTADAGLLIPGDNVLAVEIHQRNFSSSDISFDMELVGSHQGMTLVPWGSVWRYRDVAAAPREGWHGFGFDDSKWRQGPAQLGYGDGDEATVVSFGPNPSDKYITTYFRHDFTATKPKQVTNLVLSMLRDDGIRVYLNGTEVFRNNLPMQALNYQTVAPENVDGSDETTLLETWIDPRLLRAGTNTLAVEVHQSRPDSSDLSFDLRLEAR